MRILHLNDHLSWSGGIETYLLSLVPELESQGHPQMVGFANGTADLVQNARRLMFLPGAGRAARAIGFREMSALLAEERPDVVHVHNIHNTGALDACLDNVPTILHGHDYRYLCPASSFYFRRTERICERTCGPACFTATIGGRCMSVRPPYAWTYYRRVRHVAANAHRFARVIANSQYMADRFVAAGFREEQVVVLPYFCPIAPLDRPVALPNSPTILFIGRARGNKGFRHFVEALGLLPGHVRGIMVGDFSGETKGDVGRLADVAGCSNRLELRPWANRSAIREVYGAATVTVVPSLWAEPLGIVGLESLACGVPVVASAVGGVREWLIEGRTGRLVPPKDPAAIARAVMDILELPDQGRQWGANGLELIKTKFSVPRHLGGLVNAYETAASAPRTLASV